VGSIPTRASNKIPNIYDVDAGLTVQSKLPDFCALDFTLVAPLGSKFIVKIVE
jgi:hypothetical protein